MDPSKATGREQLADLELEDFGRWLIARKGNQGKTTKCCSTGTCRYGPAQGALEVETADEMDAVRLAAKLGSLG